MELKLDAKAICDIIKTCNRHHVKELKLGELHVSFDSDHKDMSNLGFDGPGRGTHVFGDQRVSDDGPQPQSIMTDDQKELLKMAHVNQELIEDPLAHEQSVIDQFMRTPHTPEEIEVMDA